jgi:hypothetical protein
MTIDFARQQQRECAEYITSGKPDQRGASLGMFDWFAEEFLMTFCALNSGEPPSQQKEQ